MYHMYIKIAIISNSERHFASGKFLVIFDRFLYADSESDNENDLSHQVFEENSVKRSKKCVFNYI